MNLVGLLVIALMMGWFGEDGHVMTPAQVDSLRAQGNGIHLLDVRTREEFDGSLGHLDGAILIPVQELDERLAELEAYREDTVVVYCRSGNRSHHATVLLRSQGFKAFNMTGGMVQWNKEQRSVVRKENR